MKVAFTVLNDAANDAAIQLDNKYYRLLTLMSKLNNLQYVKGSTRTTVYVDIDKDIQAAGTALTNGVLTPDAAAQNFTVIAEGKNLINEINVTQVAKFEKGVAYIVPASAFAPTNFIPTFPSVSISGATETLTAEAFEFNCAESTSILNATSIDGVITMKISAKEAYNKELASEKKAAVRMVEFINSAA